MLIEELGLHNFRNYSSLKHKFKPGLNIFVGKNGSGKTNLLEAIYFLIYGQSFRRVKQNNLSHNQQGSLSIKLLLKYRSCFHSLSLSLQKTQKKLFWDNKPISDLKSIRQKLKIIFFSSQDIDLILLSPAQRRDFFDRMLTIIKEEYYYAWEEYRRVLQHRNHELIKFKKSTLWDKKLINQGHKILAMRISFLKVISLPLKKIFLTLSKNPEFIPRISYSNDGQIIDDIISLEDYQKKISYYQKRDGYRGFTHFGPHSDDYFFYLKNNFSKTYSSQGENRLFVFALKFALHEYLKKVLHQNSLLILDDVFNDFDPERLSLFFNYLEKQNQVLIACANKSLFSPFIEKEKATIHQINKGVITLWNPKT